MTLRLGKLPATTDHRDLRLGAYLNAAKLPTIPPIFGHQALFPAAGWGMLGNDEYGDCAWAGPAHETMLLTKLGGHPATFTTAGVLADYAAGTGFDPHAGPPGNNPTDQGSNVRDVARYRQKTGIVDAHKTRHKIAAYVSVDPSNTSHVAAAMYLFEAAGIGIEFPTSAMDQFNNGEPWDVVAHASIDGGHYVPLVGKDMDFFYVVTWGKLQRMTRRFFAKYCDEVWAFLSNEDLTAGKSPEGFASAQLQNDLRAITAGVTAAEHR